jgi:drug/metabolite transporter (DMT)-like permease
MSTTASPAAAPVSPADRPFDATDYGLYGLTVLAWSLSWYAIALQVGTVSNEVNMVWRFSIATILMFAWVAFSGRRFRFPLADHLRFAGLGVLLFSTNFLFFYYGALFLVSGLLSVVFSLASVINMLLATVITRQRPSPRILAGGVLGFAGIALLFWPEIARQDVSNAALVGLALCFAGTLCFCFGNLVPASAQKKGLPLVSMNAWGMLYGTLWAGFLALVLGRDFIIEPTLSYLGSLVFLAVISTVLAFAAYLTLLGRIGAARAGYATVIFPVFALLQSTFLEGYQWTGFALAGLVLVAAGNVLVIRGARPK